MKLNNFGEKSQLWGNRKGESYPDFQQTNANQSFAGSIGTGRRKKGKRVLTHYENGIKLL